MWFLIIRSINEELRDYTLKPGRNTLGREDENDIVIYDDAASRYHAEIYFDDDKNTIVLQDLNSTNGTFVNGKRVYNQIVQHEDQIRIGFCLISLLNSELLSVFDPFAIQTKNIVTKELVVESIEHYSVLLHDVGRQLVNMPSLDNALDEINRLVKTMLGADECQVILSGEFSKLQEKGIPTALAHDVIEHHTAYLTSPEEPSKNTNNHIA